MHNQEWRQGWSVGLDGAVGMATGVGLFKMVVGFVMLPRVNEVWCVRG